MEKRAIIALVLSFIVIMFFFFLQEKTLKKIPPPPKTFPEEERKEKEKLTLKTSLLKLSFSPRGGRIDSWWLTDYRRELLFSPAPRLYLKEKNLDLSEEEFTLEKKEGKVIARWEKENLKVEEEFIFPTWGYHLRYILRTSLPPQEKILLSWENGLGKLKGDEERIAYYQGKLYEEKKTGIRREYKKGLSWIGMREKKILLLFIPLSEGEGIMEEKGIGLLFPPGRGEIILYLGPPNYGELRRLNEILKKERGEDLKLTQALKLSLWGSLSAGLIELIRFFYKLTGSYGVAILLLTLLIQGLLFPLSYKQLKSMQELQALQPLIKGLQRKYKSDPKRLQLELMKLYRQHRINPLAGCLPLLIQLPVFILLYRALLGFNFSEAPSFFLIWDPNIKIPIPSIPLINPKARLLDLHFFIKNLGEPSIFLVVIVGVVMFLQQKISQRQIQPQEQEGCGNLMKYFPFFIIVILWYLPAGVMLYWLAWCGWISS